MFQLVNLPRLESDRRTILNDAVYGLLITLHLRISAALSCKESCLKENFRYSNTPTPPNYRCDKRMQIGFLLQQVQTVLILRDKKILFYLAFSCQFPFSCSFIFSFSLRKQV